MDGSLIKAVHMVKVIVFSLITIIAQNTAIIAQETVLSGKITDARTGDPIPFVNVIVKGTELGTTTDFTGNYSLTVNQSIDSLTASYIGYEPKTKVVPAGSRPSINFQLAESIQNLDEMVFIADENPANAILDQAAKNKPLNDKRSLEAYQYQSYTKIELALDNLTDKFRNRKLVQKVKQVIDSVDQMAGEDGQAVLPFFISESISDFYFRNNPELKREQIVKTKISGVGVQDGTLTSQFIGSTFQEYNFYQNWLGIWEKEFISPIANGWKGFYNAFLMDSMNIEGHYCYKIDVVPKRKGDLAFTGTIWVTKEEYALKQIDLWVDKKANLNFIEKLRIQQELEPSPAGPWLPVRTRVLSDFQLSAEFGFKKTMTGLLAKFYTSNKDIVVDKPKPAKFYHPSLELQPDATFPDQEFWQKNRHQSLSVSEKNIMTMIDTLKRIPPVKRMTDLATYLVTGYIDAGNKFQFGPYLLFYAHNNIEGSRFRLGGRTKIGFSNKWILNGYLAYGTRDEDIKYAFGLDYILSRKPWRQAGIYTTRDIQQIGLTFDDVFAYRPTAFDAFARNVDYKTPYYLNESRIHFKSELGKGFNQKVILRNRRFEPVDVDSSFNYAYKLEPSRLDSPIAQDFSTTEVTLETRYGKGERWVINDNERISLGTRDFPIITFRYTLGMKGVLGGDFNYHKLALNLEKYLKVGALGVSEFSITGSKIYGAVPLPILIGHIGNESPIYVSNAYNTMGFSEFVSDTYAQLKYQHRFEGFLLNRIPLFKKLKWRTVATMNVLAGSVSDENLELHSEVGLNGLPNTSINALGKEPYVEVGYGVENIFRVLRIDAIHRLNYLDEVQGEKFALRFSLQFSF